MIIKTADDSQRSIEGLSALLERPDVKTSTRARIEREIRFISAGAAGENDAAYQIDFHRRDSRNTVVIHDLRLEVDGRVAQIDHIIATRYNLWWVCESKNFKGGLGVNEYGEWVRYWGGKSEGIASPIEQNRRHIAVLGEVFDKGLVRLPRRLGVTLRPELRSLILVSDAGKINRPKSRVAAARVDGLDSVIKADRLDTTIEQEIQAMSDGRALKAFAQKVSYEALEEVCWQLVALHKPSQVDWAARFGLPAAPSSTTAQLVAAAPAPDAVSCAVCGSKVSEAEVAYCSKYAKRFDGRILCYGCQRHRARPASGMA